MEERFYVTKEKVQVNGTEGRVRRLFGVSPFVNQYRLEVYPQNGSDSCTGDMVPIDVATSRSIKKIGKLVVGMSTSTYNYDIDFDDSLTFDERHAFHWAFVRKR